MVKLLNRLNLIYKIYKNISGKLQSMKLLLILRIKVPSTGKQTSLQTR